MAEIQGKQCLTESYFVSARAEMSTTEASAIDRVSTSRSCRINCDVATVFEKAHDATLSRSRVGTATGDRRRSK